MLAEPMRPGINIKVISEPDDDGLYQFKIGLSNGETFASLDFLEYGNNLKEFGGQLMDFPNGLKDVVIYDLGEDKSEGQPKWAYYLHMSPFCFDATGQSAVIIIVDNYAEIPDISAMNFILSQNRQR